MLPIHKANLRMGKNSIDNDCKQRVYRDNLQWIPQGLSQNLKETPQDFTKVFNTEDVTTNEVIKRNQYCKKSWVPY